MKDGWEKTPYCVMGLELDLLRFAIIRLLKPLVYWCWTPQIGY